MSLSRTRSLFQWWAAPFWLLAIFTGAKSFADNPILGSRRLNRAGLHTFRLKAAHRIAAVRRRRLAKRIDPTLRDMFDRNGFVVVPDFLPAAEFDLLRSALLQSEYSCRAQQQGDTITRRVAIGPATRRRLPPLSRLLADPRWKNLLAYIGASTCEPTYYVQTIAGGVAEGAPDPQLELHADTFHPSLKAWLFLTDVADDGRPLTYVAGSHRLTPERLEWEGERSVSVLADGDPLSRRGSLRVRPDELKWLGLPQPTRFAVPANTLVAVDTCGFHARADSDHPTLRVELWAYSRPSPFLSWSVPDLLSRGPLAPLRAGIYASLLDWLDRRGWAKQHWRPAGIRRPSEL